MLLTNHHKVWKGGVIYSAKTQIRHITETKEVIQYFCQVINLFCLVHLVI